MELQSKITVYSLSKDDIAGLIAEKLRVPKERIVVNYHLKTVDDDDRFGYSSWEEFSHISVVVDDNTTIKKGSVANV